MYRYNLKLRIGGSLHNEALMEKCSAAEVQILRFLHGSDAVVNLIELANDKTRHDQEREKLLAKYVGDSERRSRINFQQMFGAEHLELPARLHEFVLAEIQEEETKDPQKIPYRKPTSKVDAKGPIDLDDIAG